MNKKKIYRIIGLTLMGVSLLGCSSNPLDSKETNLTNEIKVVSDKNNAEDEVFSENGNENNTEKEEHKEEKKGNITNEMSSNQGQKDSSVSKIIVNNYKFEQENNDNTKEEKEVSKPVIKEDQVEIDDAKNMIKPLDITKPIIRDKDFIIEERNPTQIKKEDIKTTEVAEINNLGKYYVDQFVFFEGTKSDKDLALVEKRKNLIKTLPDTIISKLIEDNYIICYVSSDTDFTSFIEENNGCDETYTKGIGGMCDYKTRTIYLTCNLEYGDKPQTTFHEIGHAIDHYYKLKEGQSLSQRESFLEVYNSDDYTTFFDRATTYFCQSPLEFFAQNFAYYFCPMEINPMDWDGPKSKEWFEAIRWN